MSNQYTASASASVSASATGKATASGNTPEDALNNANKAALNAAIYSLVTPQGPPPEQHTCQQFCLSCIDFRFVDNITYYQDIKGYTNDYDKFVLAGASLGYNGIPNYENWILACDQTIELSHDLHEISEVSLFDHLECGAYPLVYTPEQLEGDGEFKLHVENLNKAENTILQKYSFVKKVNKYIIDLSYNVIEIP